MTPDNARDAAFQLDCAVRQLRDYATLIDHGIERPVQLALALNNIRGGLSSIGIFVSGKPDADDLHRRMLAGRQADIELLATDITMGR